MSDETPINPDTPRDDGSSGGAADGDFAGISGPELSGLLDEASSLAAELKHDLGEPEGLRVEAAEDELLAQSEDLTGRVEAELSEMERLAQEAGDALGAGGPDSDSGQPEAAAQPAADPGEVPDFMSEFTRPEPPAAKPAPASIEADSSEVPDFMSEFTQPEAPSPPPRQRTAAQTSAGTVSVAAETDAAAELRDDLLRDLMSRPERPAETEDDGGPELRGASAAEADQSSDSAASPRASIGSRFAGMAEASVGGLATMLETVDRPFHRLGDRTRWVAGLVGLATLGTTILLLLSHFLGSGPF